MRKPKHPPNLSAPIGQSGFFDLVGLVDELRSRPDDGKYLHWDQLRHRPSPKDVTHEVWWSALKFIRMSQARPIPLTDVSGKRFSVGAPEQAQELLYEITQRASGTIGASEQVTNPETRDLYLIRSLMQEGITSSIIEGASTTIPEAKEMLRAGREPRDQGERMVLNNYSTMRFIIDQGDAPLTPELVFQIHERLTRDTPEAADSAGRLRTAAEQIDIVDPSDNEVLHHPPPADQLPERMAEMCRFANGQTPGGFLHPVVRSIVLHFWLAYDHPFVDGNGRTARALFYWSMLRHDYWLCQFISISRIILKAPTQYARAFLFTETDDNDLTYFLLHQLGVIKKSLDELSRYIDSKVKQRQELVLQPHLAGEFNYRQLDIIAHALRHPGGRYDIAQHRANHGIVYQTARTDLLGLAEKGLFSKRKIGRTWYFFPAPDLEEQISGKAAGNDHGRS